MRIPIPKTFKLCTHVREVGQHQNGYQTLLLAENVWMMDVLCHKKYSEAHPLF
jgi:hypothetical protein